MGFYLIGMIIATILGITDKKIDRDDNRPFIICVIALLSWISILCYIFFNYANKVEK